MKLVFAVVAGLFVSAALLVSLGCASSMVSEGTKVSDSAITSVVEASLAANEEVKARQNDVRTLEGHVYLTGVVETVEAQREAVRVAWRTEGVRGVSNDLTIGERTVGDWIDDVMIGSKVKAQLMSNTLIRAGDIDVSSSQGVVTLIGRVGTQAIKSDAERIARATKGVTGVDNELRVGVGGR